MASIKKGFSGLVRLGLFSFFTLLLLGGSALALSIDLTPSGLGLPGEQTLGLGPYYVNTDLYLDAYTTSQVGQDTTKGTIYITSDGAGVQSNEWDYNKHHYKGSKEISGKGGHASEALILGFVKPQEAKGITITLKHYVKAEDNVDLWLYYKGGYYTLTTVNANTIESIFTPSAGTLTIDLYTLGVSGLLDRIEVWAEHDGSSHFVVGGLTYGGGDPVPEPGTLLLLSSGLGLVPFLKRRRG